MKATFVNVGYGDCILLQNENGYTALIDGGSDLESEFAGDPYRIRASDYLKEQHISHLDAVFISHIHEDHVCGLEKVLNCSPVRISNFSRGGYEDGWEKLVLMKSHGFPMPVLLRRSQNGNWRLLAAPYGKKQLAGLDYLQKALDSKDGLLLFDLFASGETGTEYGNSNYWDYHNTGRTCFWLGWTLLGEWIRDYTAAATWLRKQYEVKSITSYGYK